eukprot:g17300.t1
MLPSRPRTFFSRRAFRFLSFAAILKSASRFLFDSFGDDVAHATEVLTPSDDDDAFLFPFSTDGHSLDDIKKLLEADPALATRASGVGETCLHAAAISPETTLAKVKLLTAAGAAVDAKTVGDYTRTPVHWWLYSQAEERDAILKHLVEEGADPFASTETAGEDVFELAMTIGKPNLGLEILDWYVKRGAGAAHALSVPEAEIERKRKKLQVHAGAAADHGDDL